jgi:hypothetical protein
LRRAAVDPLRSQQAHGSINQVVYGNLGAPQREPLEHRIEPETLGIENLQALLASCRCFLRMQQRRPFQHAKAHLRVSLTRALLQVRRDGLIDSLNFLA